MAVEVTRRDLSATALRREAARSRGAKAARRMLVIALVLDGHSRRDAAEACGMDRQTLRDWVHRYNAEGLAGLADRRAPGGARDAPFRSAGSHPGPLGGGGSGARARRRGAVALPRPAGAGRPRGCGSPPPG